MNLAMTITLDGLVRALRWKEHQLVEDIEAAAPRDGQHETDFARPMETAIRGRVDDDGSRS